MSFKHTNANDIFLHTDLNEPLETVVLHHGRPRFFSSPHSSWHWLTGTRYRITNRGIEIKSGVFDKCIDNIELWRVKDIEFVQSLGICSCFTLTGTMIIHSEDSDYGRQEYTLYGVRLRTYEALRLYLDELNASQEKNNHDDDENAKEEASNTGSVNEENDSQ